MDKSPAWSSQDLGSTVLIPVAVTWVWQVGHILSAQNSAEAIFMLNEKIWLKIPPKYCPN